MGRKKKETGLVKKKLIEPDAIEGLTIGYTNDFMQKYSDTSSFKKWSNTEVKLFYLFLCEIDWKKGQNPNLIELDNSYIAEQLGLNFDEDGERNVGVYVRKHLSFMASNCDIKLYNPHERRYIQGPLITLLDNKPRKTTIEINKHFMPHFEQLFEYNELTGKGFHVSLLPDILEADSIAAQRIYENLKSYHTRPGAKSYKHVFSVDELKKIIGLEPETYTSKRIIDGEEKLHFDRSKFEQRVLVPALENAAGRRMLRIKKYKDGKYFRKIKNGNKIVGYEVEWTVFDTDMVKKIEKKRINEAKNNGNDDYIIVEPDPFTQVIEIETDISQYL